MATVWQQKERDVVVVVGSGGGGVAVRANEGERKKESGRIED